MEQGRTETGLVKLKEKHTFNPLEGKSFQRMTSLSMTTPVGIS